MSLAIEKITVVHNGDVMHLAAEGAIGTGLGSASFPVSFSHVWKGNLGRVHVAVPWDANAIFQSMDRDAGLSGLSSRIKNVLKSMLVYQAALRHWPDRGQVCVESDRAYNEVLAMVAEPDGLDQTVAELGKLLLACRDAEASVNAVGAWLSLGVSLQAIRRTARLLFRDGYINAGGAVYGDDKQESFDPGASIVLNDAKLDRFADWLLKRGKLSNLPVRFDFSRLHPEIAAAARPSFESGRWADAQFAALKAATVMARKKAGVDHLADGGAKQMESLFSPNRKAHSGPWLTVSASGPDWYSAQEGFQKLFEGAQKLTNPVRHHEPHFGVDADSAFEYVVLASLLARVVDRAGVELTYGA